MKPISERYQLESTPLQIKGYHLDILQLADWGPFIKKLEDEGEAYVKNFPFWIKIWEASIVLSDYLLNLDLNRELAILEVGGGLGVTGLFLGAAGHHVTITDYEQDAISLLNLNIEKNGLDRVDSKQLDWHQPGIQKQFDVICGSEVLYNEEAVTSLYSLVNELLKPGGSIYLAHDFGRRPVKSFLDKAHYAYDISGVKRTLREKNTLHKIVIHKLTSKD